MHLAGQLVSAVRRRAKPAPEAGYAMAVLLVALSVMAVMMTVAMPVWKHMAQREKETELVFRGQQYARAIELMQRKMPGALPPNLDLLVTQKFLRKKYKDPITGEDFDTLSPAQAVPAATEAAPQPGGRGATSVSGRGATPPSGRGATPAAGAGRSNAPTAPGLARPGAVAGGLQAGIIGVVSKSKESSIRLYNGRSHYNEWVFQASERTQVPGGATGTPSPGQQGGAGQPPVGGRGQAPPPGGRGVFGTPQPGGRGSPAFPRP